MEDTKKEIIRLLQDVEDEVFIRYIYALIQQMLKH